MRGPRPAAAAAGLSVALALVAPTTSTRAAFSDTATVAGAQTSARSLQAPVLQCSTPLLQPVRFVWTASQEPALLTYTARVTSPAGVPDPVVVVDGATRRVDVPVASAMGGRQVIVEVTGTLPGTTWTVTGQGRFNVTLGLLASCA